MGIYQDMPVPINRRERIVWNALLEYLQNGVPDPEYWQIQKLTGMSRSTVVRHLTRLKELGCISVRRTGRGNHYTSLIPVPGLIPQVDEVSKSEISEVSKIDTSDVQTIADVLPLVQELADLATKIAVVLARISSFSSLSLKEVEDEKPQQSVQPRQEQQPRLGENHELPVLSSKPVWEVEDLDMSNPYLKPLVPVEKKKTTPPVQSNPVKTPAPSTAPTTKTRIDPLTFAEAIGEISGDKVHRVLTFHLVESDDPFWIGKLSTLESVQKHINLLIEQYQNHLIREKKKAKVANSAANHHGMPDYMRGRYVSRSKVY